MTDGWIRRWTQIIVMVFAAAGLAPAATGSVGEEGSSETVSPTPDAGIVAYYFHGNKRCSTCRKLEAYSRKAIEGGFADELAASARHCATDSAIGCRCCSAGRCESRPDTRLDSRPVHQPCSRGASRGDTRIDSRDSQPDPTNLLGTMGFRIQYESGTGRGCS